MLLVRCKSTINRKQCIDFIIWKNYRYGVKRRKWAKKTSCTCFCVNMILVSFLTKQSNEDGGLHFWQWPYLAHITVHVAVNDTSRKIQSTKQFRPFLKIARFFWRASVKNHLR